MHLFFEVLQQVMIIRCRHHKSEAGFSFLQSVQQDVVIGYLDLFH